MPVAVQIFGPYSGALQDNGENLELTRPGTPTTNGVPYIAVDAVRYNDRLPWPVSANGAGPSLQRLVVLFHLLGGLDQVLHNGPHRGFHVLHADPFEPRVECVFARENVGAGQTHE